MIKNFFKDVFLWNCVGGVETKQSPGLPSIEQRQLMLTLLQEEVVELQVGVHKKNLTEIADALGDIIVICASTAAQYGIDLTPVVEEIMRSNWSKFKKLDEEPLNFWARVKELQEISPSISTIRHIKHGEDLYEVVLREDGKIIKHPETYFKPNLSRILKK